MNIFYLDSNPETAAQYHCDKHVVKMLLESAQLLSTAMVEKGFNAPYKSTHKHHPCCLWILESRMNYDWLYGLFKSLCKEYTFRYNKVHATDLIFQDYILELVKFRASLPIKIRTDPPQCMPEQYKNEHTVQAYRDYYQFEKIKFAKYTNRETPFWLDFSLI